MPPYKPRSFPVIEGGEKTYLTSEFHRISTTTTAIESDITAIESDITAIESDMAALFGAVRTQIFTGSGTYTPHANMLYCTIEAVGGGGGGGGAVGEATSALGGAGGGSGGYSRSTKTASDIGVSKTVTIGAGGAGGASGAHFGSDGGDTSVGSLVIAKGGSGATYVQYFVTGAHPAGAGGVAGTGSFTATGSPGQSGWYAPGTTEPRGSFGVGGSSVFGGGGLTTWVGSAGVTGGAGTAYGGGGGGGASYATASNAAGGAGAAGVVIITEFCSA